MHRQIMQLIKVNSLFMFALNMFAPLYAVYVLEITPDVVQIGGIWAFYCLSAGTLTFILSRMENSFKHTHQFLILGFIMRAAGWAGYLMADSLWQLYAIQLLLAIGEACGSPAYNAMYSRYLDKGKFASEWGLLSAVNYFIVAAAAFGGSLIADAYGFHALFIIMIFLSLISTMLALHYAPSLSKK